jgi:transcriptional regulator with XRE-family HTH domain
VFKFRKERKINQTDIATIIGVNRVFITDNENPSNRAIILTHTNLLADHRGMSPKYFLPEKAML